MEKYFEFRYTMETIGLVIGLGFCIVFAVLAITVIVGEKISDRRRKKRIQRMKEAKK